MLTQCHMGSTPPLRTEGVSKEKDEDEDDDDDDDDDDMGLRLCNEAPHPIFYRTRKLQQFVPEP